MALESIRRIAERVNFCFVIGFFFFFVQLMWQMVFHYKKIISNCPLPGVNKTYLHPAESHRQREQQPNA